LLSGKKASAAPLRVKRGDLAPERQDSRSGLSQAGALPLFLLFLQEIISERHRLDRRNPGVLAVRLGENSACRHSGPL
jgi:hypothetical protein